MGTAAGLGLRRLCVGTVMLVWGLREPRVVTAAPDGNRLTPSDVAAAALTMESGEAAGRGTSRLQPAEWVFYPVRSGEKVLAAIGLARDDGLLPVAEEDLPLLTNLLDQVA